MNSKLFKNQLWQSDEWEKFQQQCGNETFRVHNVLVIVRKTAFQKVFFEIPRACGEWGMGNGEWEELWNELETKAREKGAVFTRIFPGTSSQQSAVSSQQKQFIIQNSEFKINTEVPEIFPEHTLIIDLRKSEEEILADMKQKGRYNIGIAKKKGVEVFRSEDVASFYKILSETLVRDEFSGHPQKVYENMLTSFGENGDLFLARYEEKIIAGGIFLISDDVMTYYYGASANEYRNVMAPYLLQWRAIQEAKKRGCTFFDFLGIAPNTVETTKLGVSLTHNHRKNHRLAGVSEFKEKFGGIRIEYSPAFEIIHRLMWDRGIRILKNLRRILSGR
ncbi:peptidoglycan bridge formation glycyltransferase FemA/FemB family protein [Candidatus Peregrinibacteria bacterium]|nr:peptidoglycan bridge formation glycyltransferase FemA/FemB family protein [Candidatus Peregrinibacteria bacterium]